MLRLLTHTADAWRQEVSRPGGVETKLAARAGWRVGFHLSVGPNCLRFVQKFAVLSASSKTPLSALAEQHSCRVDIVWTAGLPARTNLSQPRRVPGRLTVEAHRRDDRMCCRGEQCWQGPPASLSTSKREREPSSVLMPHLVVQESTSSTACRVPRIQ